MKKLMYLGVMLQISSLKRNSNINFTKTGVQLSQWFALVDGEAASWFYRINESKKDSEIQFSFSRFEPYAEAAVHMASTPTAGML